MPLSLHMLRCLGVLAVAFGLGAVPGEGRAQESVAPNLPTAETLGQSCPANTVCLGVQDFRMSTGFTRDKEQILATAVPDMLQVALLRYPGIQLISDEDLWRALHETYHAPEDWIPANLSTPEVLRKAGANYVLQGSLYERQGVGQLVGEVVSLSEEEKPWRSGSLESEFFAERRLSDGVASFAAAIVRGLAKNGQLDYQTRKFVAAPFCDVSEPSTSSSTLYASDLPKALAERGRSVDAVTMPFLESEPCVSEGNAGEFARANNADAVVTGIVNQKSTDSIAMEARVFIPELDVWQKLPGQNTDASYLEQKYVLIERFGQFLSAALTANGRWDVDVLKTPRQLPDLLHKVDQLIKLGSLDAAELLLAEALSIDANSAEAHHRLGLVQYQRNRLELAVAEQREALKERADFPEAYAALGDALVALRDYEEAEKAYNEQLRLQPDSVGAYSALGNLASFQGNTDTAIEQLGNALRLDPENTSVRERLADLYYDRAQAHLDSQEYKAAVDDFGLALESDPHPNPARYFSRAYALSFFEDESPGHGYLLAIDDYKKAIEIFRGEQDPGFLNAVNAYLNLQELHLVQGEYEKSIEIGREFLGLDFFKDFRTPADESIAQFQIVLALILGSRPYKKALGDLRARIKSSGALDWDFVIFDKFFGEKLSSLSSGQVRAIQEVKSLVQLPPSP